MNPIYHELNFDLDTGLLEEPLMQLPHGFLHIIKLKLTKGGVSGYELGATGSELDLFFGVRNPVNEADAVFSIITTDWVYDTATGVYEAGFPANERPLSLVSSTTFGTKLKVTDAGGTPVSTEFQTVFRNASLPSGIDPCDLYDDTLPASVRNYFDTQFRYANLPDKPSLPAPTNTATLSTVAITAGLGSVTPTIPTGEKLIGWYVNQLVLNGGTVEVSTQLNEDGQIEIISPPANENTHELVIVTIA